MPFTPPGPLIPLQTRAGDDKSYRTRQASRHTPNGVNIVIRGNSVDKSTRCRLQGWPPLRRNERGTMARVDLRRVERAANRRDAAQAELYSAIRDAYGSGETLRDIAKAARMSHQGVHKIVTQRSG